MAQFLTLGCPPVEDYLKAREQNGLYNPVDEVGFGKLVLDVQNRRLVIHWSDGTQNEITPQIDPFFMSVFMGV